MRPTNFRQRASRLDLNPHLSAWRWVSLCVLLAAGSNPGLAADPVERQFEQNVRPILVSKCLKCHGEQKQEGQLRLDSRSAMLRGGDSGPAVVPGEPAESLLVEAVKYESLEMPPTGQLSNKEIEQLQSWISSGAVWPEHLEQLRETSGVITADDRQWWAFGSLERPAVPSHKDDDWSLTPIDRFVYQQLATRGMQPAPRAQRSTLIRRLYFNLLGLPPTPKQINQFVDDSSPRAWENLIDKLLSDKRYGEHWARYWLDIVRYSESDGWNQDAFRPHIWRYRDYVVKSFNTDKPYPEFVREQLAGDEIEGHTAEQLAATGFLRLGIYEYNQRDARSHWDDIMNEMTDVTGDVFLGMGMACARCHDHKFDPLLQVDYFKLRAFFEPISWRDDIRGGSPDQTRRYQQQLAVWEEATCDVRRRIDELLKPYYDRKWKSTVEKFPLEIQACYYKPVEQRTSWEHQMAYLVSRQFYEEGGGPLKDIKKDDSAAYETLKKELAEFDELKPAPLPELMTATDFAGQISPTVIPDDPRQVPVEPGFLSVLSPTDDATHIKLPSVKNSSGRRTALAQWIGDPRNPLTTRVIVNRIWQQHFGQGIVPTASDFGHRGQPPTHPELLDWLTVRFVENGWSIKQLHRLILSSAVWQQSATHPEAERYQELDPAENLLWRARVKRLSAEQIRDAMLSISGELTAKVGGPSVAITEPRRSLYVKSFRNQTDTFLHAFDVANGLKSVSQRNTTTTPTQALLMINGQYVLQRATTLADRVQRQPGTASEKIRHLFRTCWGRDPAPAELAAAMQFVATQSTENALQQKELTDLCHVLFNSNEFLYVD